MGFGVVKHKLDQFLFDQVFNVDPIRKSGRLKRDIHKPAYQLQIIVLNLRFLLFKLFVNF